MYMYSDKYVTTASGEIPKTLKTICDQILENRLKSHMKSGEFLHVFISTYMKVFMGYLS